MDSRPVAASRSSDLDHLHPFFLQRNGCSLGDIAGHTAQPVQLGELGVLKGVFDEVAALLPGGAENACS